MRLHGIDLTSEAVRAFCKKWKIRQLSVFGSILSDDFRQDSDVDVMADFDAEAEWDLFDHLDMQEELAGIMGRKVDLLTRYAVDTDPNWRFKNTVLTSAQTIYGR